MQFIYKILPALLAVASVGMGQTLTIAGNTDGSTSSVLGGSNGGVTFASNSFTVSNLASGGTATGVNLGTFSSYCGGGAFGCLGVSAFFLDITFTLPTGVNGNPFTFTQFVNAELQANPVAGNYAVTFPNQSEVFTFDDGSEQGSITLSFEENNSTYSELDLANAVGPTPGTTALLGDFTATFSPDPVPEPSSLLLLGTAACGFVFVLRRRLASQS